MPRLAFLEIDPFFEYLKHSMESDKGFSSSCWRLYMDVNISSAHRKFLFLVWSQSIEHKN